MGGKAHGDEATADQASTGLGGMLGNLGGIFGGAGGMGGLGGMIKSMFGALGGASPTAGFDLENPPPPVEDSPDTTDEPQVVSSRIDSKRKGMFDD